MDKLVKALTATTLEECAPEELPLLERYEEAQRHFGSASRGPQGFGLEMAAALLTPLLVKFFDKFVEKIGSNAGDSVYAVIKTYFSGKTPSVDAGQAERAICTALIAEGVTANQAPQVAKAVAKALHEQKALLLR